MKKIACILLAFALCLMSTVIAFAHSGRTDENGGHTDWSTGIYHYHHGYPAHSHPDGICPYEAKGAANQASGNNGINKNTSYDLNSSLERIEDITNEIWESRSEEYKSTHRTLDEILEDEALQEAESAAEEAKLAAEEARRAVEEITDISNKLSDPKTIAIAAAIWIGTLVLGFCVVYFIIRPIIEKAAQAVKRKKNKPKQRSGKKRNDDSDDVYVYAEAANGMTVRIPLKNFDQWQKAQEEIKKKQYEPTQEEIEFARKLRDLMEGKK